jgi:isoleucyl-tRNA synthetase
VEDLSNWYVRRSRRRFWDGDAAAFATLRTCLLTVAKLLAPFCPFMADEIYDNLDGTLESVHLCDFPTAASLAETVAVSGAAPGDIAGDVASRGELDGDRAARGETSGREVRDEELERAMALARETVRLGLGARGKSKIKVRQPLGEAVVVAAGREREAIERLADVVRDELNVKRVRFVAAADELGSYEVKANYRKLGPIFGKAMPLAADAIAALDPARVAAALRGGEAGAGTDAGAGRDEPGATGIGIAVDGREHVLTRDDVILTMRAPEGYSVEREGAHAVALDLAIDDELREEGHAREIVHAVQAARKAAGLEVEDRIELALEGDATLTRAAQAHRDYLAGETLAVELRIGGGADAAASEDDFSQQLQIDGLTLWIGLRRVPADRA